MRGVNKSGSSVFMQIVALTFDIHYWRFRKKSKYVLWRRSREGGNPVFLDSSGCLPSQAWRNFGLFTSLSILPGPVLIRFSFAPIFNFQGLYSWKMAGVSGHNCKLVRQCRSSNQHIFHPYRLTGYVNKVSADFERNWDSTCGLGRFLTNSLKIFVSSRYIIWGDFL